MDFLVIDGNYVPGSTGIPKTVSGLEELLQLARLRLTLKKGDFLYAPELGSDLARWNEDGSKKTERAQALANEALLEQPGVQAVGAAYGEKGLTVTIKTPLGEGEITFGDL